uniref:Uncharacterized protein n=1 Tax=Panagrolaimus sp. JU765 TaxID=591449 RepID=A0AC34REN5_9BILA
MWKVVNLLFLCLTLCSARVDISNFFPFGTNNGDQILTPGDDTSSPAQFLNISFPFFGINTNKLYLNINGAISFMNPISTYTPTCAPVSADYSMVSPFWADVMTAYDKGSTAIYYRQTTEYKVLNQFQQQLYKVFPYLNGTAPVTWAFIATWYNVTYYPDNAAQTKRNTFQCALGTNGVNSFAIFYYNQVQWTTGDASEGVNGLGGIPAQVGFDSGDGQNRYMLDVSCTGNVIDVADISNVGPPGVFIFRIDSANIQTGSTITALPTTRSHYQTTTTTTPPNPLSDRIGGQCSTNYKNAWLDVVLLIDVSSSMAATDLKKYGNQLSTILSRYPIGQVPKHSTRVSVIAFSSDVQLLLDLKTVTNFGALRNILGNLNNQSRSDDTGGNLLGAFQKAKTILDSQKSYRPGVVVLSAAAYNPDSFGNAHKVTNQLKGDGVKVVTIAFDSAQGAPPDLSGLASEGFEYKSSDANLRVELDTAFVQINCFCPKSTIQFRTYNDQTGRYTYYADCLNFYNGATSPEYSEDSCDPGILTSVTSQDKLDFIIDNTFDSGTYKNITVGAYNTNGWKWYNYNDTSYPVGRFPASASSFSGKYGYFYNNGGFNWKFGANNGGADNAMPYVCQYRACDADYFCDVNLETKK